jgi:hypothetical protein
LVKISSLLFNKQTMGVSPSLKQNTFSPKLNQPQNSQNLCSCTETIKFSIENSLKHIAREIDFPDYEERTAGALYSEKCCH